MFHLLGEREKKKRLIPLAKVVPRFEVFLRSHEVGMRKPEKKMYKLALEKLECDASEVIFIDDIGKNLKSAREMGMRTILASAPPPRRNRLLGRAEEGAERPRLYFHGAV